MKSLQVLQDHNINIDELQSQTSECIKPGFAFVKNETLCIVEKINKVETLHETKDIIVAEYLNWQNDEIFTTEIDVTEKPFTYIDVNVDLEELAFESWLKQYKSELERKTYIVNNVVEFFNSTLEEAVKILTEEQSKYLEYIKLFEDEFNMYDTFGNEFDMLGAFNNKITNEPKSFIFYFKDIYELEDNVWKLKTSTPSLSIYKSVNNSIDLYSDDLLGTLTITDNNKINLTYE